MMDTEIKEYALNFIETVLNHIEIGSENEETYLTYSHYFLPMPNIINGLHIGIEVREGEIDETKLKNEVQKYGFELSLTITNGLNVKINKPFKIYTIYKSLLHVKEEIRIKGLKELLL